MQQTITNHRELPGAISRAADGDTITCVSQDLAELGERARQRMCPTKRLTFLVTNLDLIDDQTRSEVG